jgi:ribosome biogenesis GTPase
VVVGDRVTVGRYSAEPIISEVLERHNYIVRESPRRRLQRHVLASNVDQAMLITTVVQPTFKAGFADRFLVTCEAYHIPAIVAVNKEDLWKDERDAFTELSRIYTSAGYAVVSVSAENGSHLEEVSQLLVGKTTLIAGQSGVGKSSLVNKLIPGLDLKTSDLSGYTGKGTHTTTFAAMFALPGGGFLIDTPGVKEWTVTDMKPEELCHYFPEFREAMDNCRFNNCLHVDEPGCEVKQRVAEGEIAASRHEGYLSMLAELKKLNRWEIDQ